MPLPLLICRQNLNLDRVRLGLELPQAAKAIIRIRLRNPAISYPQAVRSGFIKTHELVEILSNDVGFFIQSRWRCHQAAAHKAEQRMKIFSERITRANLRVNV